MTEAERKRKIASWYENRLGRRPEAGDVDYWYTNTNSHADFIREVETGASSGEFKFVQWWHANIDDTLASNLNEGSNRQYWLDEIATKGYENTIATVEATARVNKDWKGAGSSTSVTTTPTTATTTTPTTATTTTTTAATTTGTPADPTTNNSIDNTTLTAILTAHDKGTWLKEFYDRNLSSTLDVAAARNWLCLFNDGYTEEDVKNAIRVAASEDDTWTGSREDGELVTVLDNDTGQEKQVLLEGDALDNYHKINDEYQSIFGRFVDEGALITYANRDTANIQSTLRGSEEYTLRGRRNQLPESEWTHVIQNKRGDWIRDNFSPSKRLSHGDAQSGFFDLNNRLNRAGEDWREESGKDWRTIDAGTFDPGHFENEKLTTGRDFMSWQYGKYDELNTNRKVKDLQDDFTVKFHAGLLSDGDGSTKDYHGLDIKRDMTGIATDATAGVVFAAAMSGKVDWEFYRTDATYKAAWAGVNSIAQNEGVTNVKGDTWDIHRGFDDFVGITSVEEIRTLNNVLSDANKDTFREPDGTDWGSIDLDYDPGDPEYYSKWVDQHPAGNAAPYRGAPSRHTAYTGYKPRFVYTDADGNALAEDGTFDWNLPMSGHQISYEKTTPADWTDAEELTVQDYTRPIKAVDSEGNIKLDSEGNEIIIWKGLNPAPTAPTTQPVSPDDFISNLGIKDAENNYKRNTVQIPTNLPGEKTAGDLVRTRPDPIATTNPNPVVTP